MTSPPLSKASLVLLKCSWLPPVKHHYLSHMPRIQELKSVANAKTTGMNALMDKVFVRNNLTCQSTVEVLYFSSGCFRDICDYCAGSDKLERNEGAYPICGKCSNKEAPTKTLQFVLWQMLDWKKKKKKNLPASSDLKKSGLRTIFFFAWPYQKVICILLYCVLILARFVFQRN